MDKIFKIDLADVDCSLSICLGKHVARMVLENYGDRLTTYVAPEDFAAVAESLREMAAALESTTKPKKKVLRKKKARKK